MSRIIDDDFLYTNMPQAEKNMLSKIPSEGELFHKFSNRFKRKMGALLKYERRTPSMRMIVRQMKTAAVVFVIVLSMAFGTVVSVEAYRIRFFEFVTTIWEELTSTIIHSDDNADHDKLTAIESTYIPQGYDVLERESDEYTNTVIYINKENAEIYYSQKLTTQSEFIFDSESIEVDTIIIGNQTVYVLENKGIVQICWNDQSNIFTLIGELDQTELIKMATGIIKK